MGSLDGQRGGAATEGDSRSGCGTSRGISSNGGRWGEANDEEKRQGKVKGGIGMCLCTYMLLLLSNTVDVGSC